MDQPLRPHSVSTPTYTRIAASLVLIGLLTDLTSGPLLGHTGPLGTATEFLSSGLVFLGTGSLLLLLPISAFRPEKHFYLHGDCRLRARRFTAVALTLLAAYLLLAIPYIYHLS